MAKRKKLVQVESICSQQEADVKAPLIAAAYGATWTGSWMPLMADGLGVIEVEIDAAYTVAPSEPNFRAGSLLVKRMTV